MILFFVTSYTIILAVTCSRHQAKVLCTNIHVETEAPLSNKVEHKPLYKVQISTVARRELLQSRNVLVSTNAILYESDLT
jgi:hypothetical protein